MGYFIGGDMSRNKKHKLQLQEVKTHDVVKAFQANEKAKQLQAKVDQINNQEKELEEKFRENEKKPMSEILKSCESQINEDLKDIKIIDIDI